MNRMLQIAAGLLLLAQITACSTAAQQKFAAVIGDIQTRVGNACAFFNPVATDAQMLYTLDPDVDLAIDDMKALCATNATIDASTVQTLAQTTIPVAVKKLASMPNVSPSLKQEIGGALTLANGALNAAATTYAPATPTAASAPEAASTPPAGGAPIQ
ncbi:hypothetical protein FAZ95_13710 [Trinickia violacea]|uniref:Uncharacterized protein n=1 Tax=Trinickia violacea TaxID=2571746 RepID=A0A4P8IWF6_9BURK|nr:hypothetical protein [Trinickia violacea]QCP50139.1 hypothetical protein FAZ95_13710 [Trinickia violacea]